jgi:transcriptional regulator with XRE-family HTH domain
LPRKATNNAPPPAGQRFLYWIAEAALAARTSANASAERVADLIGVGSPTVKRFEQAKHWPADPDRVMAAYAEVAGLDDARQLYQRALDLWYEHGSRPLLSAKDDDGLTTGQKFEREIGGRRAQPRAPAEPDESSTRAPRRRASH